MKQPNSDRQEAKSPMDAGSSPARSNDPESQPFQFHPTQHLVLESGDSKAKKH